MRRTILTLAALSVATPAAAFFDPPKRYQGTPDMPVNVIRLPIATIQKRCSTRFLTTTYGCARVVEGPPRRCIVIIPDGPQVNIAFPFPPTPIVTPDMILRHELGHCNGWPKHHPRG